jgi:hypothetical protein
MANSSPLNVPETLAEFDIPILATNQYIPATAPVVVVANVEDGLPVAGPGGERDRSSLAQVVSFLQAFAALIPSLTQTQLQQLGTAFGVVPPGLAINNAVNYLKYLEGRDALLLNTLSGVMNLTK